jgi:hypothetical protein
MRSLESTWSIVIRGSPSALIEAIGAGSWTNVRALVTRNPSRKTQLRTAALREPGWCRYAARRPRRASAPSSASPAAVSATVLGSGTAATFPRTHGFPDAEVIE